MKKREKRNRIICGVIAILLVASMVVGTIVTAFASEYDQIQEQDTVNVLDGAQPEIEEATQAETQAETQVETQAETQAETQNTTAKKIVTLGADLSEDDRNLMLQYFNVDESDTEIITITNEDEHKYLDNIATPQQIGTHTFSCTYIESTDDGGIHIKTANLTWVTCDMIRNALITSGITNCNVVCACPKEVSGTGALTGIFKAYSEINSDELNEEKMNLASEELVQTMDIAETVGQDKATDLMGNVKEAIIEGDIESEDDVVEIIDNYLKENNIELTDEQKSKLVELLYKISEQKYNIDEIKKALTDVEDTVNALKEKSNEALGILDKIVNALKTFWQKITGKYDEIQKSEKDKAIKEQLGIISETNDSLLGGDTVITETDNKNTEEETEEKSKDNTETKEETNNKEDNRSIFSKIGKWFNGLFNGNDKKTTEETQKKEQDIKNKDTETKTENNDNIKNKEESSSTSGALDNVTYDNQNRAIENKSNNSNGQSFYDITE